MIARVRLPAPAVPVVCSVAEADCERVFAADLNKPDTIR